jgi:dTDP-4-amino-4,6-dideoxygalactose transaminase
MDAIYVTRPFLPPLEEYQKYVAEIFERGILTNQGPLLCELEFKLKDYLGVSNLHFLTNGTLALQLSLSSLGISGGEIITTPFSYVATCSSILWERCTPIFVDIESNNFTIDASKIEKKITKKTRAILGVHVFGYACDIEKIQDIAKKHNLKVIYDGAHCFGSRFKGKSLVSYGDISTLSFHATKLFNTIEGGACIVNDRSVSEKLELQKRFGHHFEDYQTLGINAKASEFQAAMGLAIFPHIDKIISERKELSELYDLLLEGQVKRPKAQEGLDYNYSYYPVIFNSEKDLLEVFKALNTAKIYPRRYFYPSLNKLSYIPGDNCPIAEDIASRIACLPLYVGLKKEGIKRICTIIKEELMKNE